MSSPLASPHLVILTLYCYCLYLQKKMFQHTSFISSYTINEKLCKICFYKFSLTTSSTYFTSHFTIVGLYHSIRIYKQFISITFKYRIIEETYALSLQPVTFLPFSFPYHWISPYYHCN